MTERDEKIRSYFASWLTGDNACWTELFSEDVVYTECYGPEYHGLSQMKQWFADWTARGKVLRWDGKRFMHDGNSTCVEWYFLCEYDGGLGGFDGVTWIDWDENGRIVSLREFQSKAEHVYPYGV